MVYFVPGLYSGIYGDFCCQNSDTGMTTSKSIYLLRLRTKLPYSWYSY